MYLLKVLLFYICFGITLYYVSASSAIPVLSLNRNITNGSERLNCSLKPKRETQFMRYMGIIDKEKDTSEYWRETDILSLVKDNDKYEDDDTCPKGRVKKSTAFEIPSRRLIRPICKTNEDYQICPQCPRLTNETICELFRDSCRERRVHRSEYRSYCDKKYGKWRTVFIPADYSQCRCCDECIFYRELDQSCVPDENSFDTDEFLPVTTIDFRAGCNPYLGHPQQEQRALRCDSSLRRCVPVSVPSISHDNLNNMRKSFRYEPPTGGTDCPVSCLGFECQQYSVGENKCAPGAFIPDKEQCNCCGKCSLFQQLNQKCAEIKKTVHIVNGSKETEIEEEFLEPGCDDGLVCRQGRCQDIHQVKSKNIGRMKRDENIEEPKEPCKKDLKTFKKKYGPDGHLHYEAPQCTPLWLYAPVQCRRFVCYCALEDGTFIEGIKVPRVEVSNMNCDCAREKCRTGSDVECDGYGNYKEAVFSPHVEPFNGIEEGDDSLKKRFASVDDSKGDSSKKMISEE